MYLEKNSEAKWLIKAENKILGPYSYDQIIDLIHKKQISFIDEIRDPETRWLYVRENPKFKNITEEMRKEINAEAESTKTHQSITKTIAKTIAKTIVETIVETSAETSAETITETRVKTIEEAIAEAMRKTKTNINGFANINFEAKDMVIENEVLDAHTETPVKSRKEAVAKQTKVYGAYSDKFVKSKVQRYFNKVLGLLVAGVAAVVFSFFGYMHYQKSVVIKQEEEQTRQVKKYIFLGFHQKVADIFSQMPIASQKKVIPEVLEIYPLLEALGLVSIDDIESLKLNLSLVSEQKANIELIYFGLSIQKNNYGDALDYLVKATTLQSASYLIKENEALLYLKKGQYLKAFNIYNNIFRQEKNGRYLLGMVQSYFGLPNSESYQFGRALLSNLEKYTSVYYDYKKELLLGQIALAYELNETVQYKAAKDQFFNTPCRLSAEFTKPGLLAPHSYAWQDLSGIGAIIQKNLSEEELVLFQLHDYLESNKMSDAAEFSSNSLAKVNSAEVRAQMSLLLLDAQKRNNEVIAFEKAHKLDMNSELNHFLVAKNKIALGGGENITTHLDFLGAKRLVFYRDWLQLEQLLKKNSVSEIKTFLKDHFVTMKNFNPVYMARSLVN